MIDFENAEALNAFYNPHTLFYMVALEWSTYVY